MKTVLNKIRRLNISNSVIYRSLGFDKVQLKAFNEEPYYNTRFKGVMNEPYPIMNGKLERFYDTKLTDKHKRVQLNMVPTHNVSSDAHISSQRPGWHSAKENVWTKTKAASKRLYQRILGK